MPRIDPQQLLKCLSVLLSSEGGIKSNDEVQRLASLMTKFSKKLVSKCIYVSILKATEKDLLNMFMSAGGWDLTHNWLCDGVTAKNWPLVKELVELLLICPVDIDRLKTNACPKLIKTLSKDLSANEQVRSLACNLVEQWLRIVRGDDQAKPQEPVLTEPICDQSADEEHASDDQLLERSSDEVAKSDSVDGTCTENHLPVYKITIRDGKKVLMKTEISSNCLTSTVGTGAEDLNQDEVEKVEDEAESEVGEDDDDDEDFVIKPVKLGKNKKLTAARGTKSSLKKKPAQIQVRNKKERDSTESSTSGKSPSRVKDSKPVSKKSKEQIPKLKPSKTESSLSSLKAKKDENVKSSDTSKEPVSSVNSKSKEKPSLSLKNKKTLSGKKEKDSKLLDSKLNKEDIRTKNKLIDNSFLTDKEKETLSKFITPPISKVGKIPKKSSSNKEEKQSEEKNRTLKEEPSETKPELKKNTEVKKPPDIKRKEKNFSIEPKRPLPSETKPKTVKMFHSKFRSTGLEEEVLPPPPQKFASKKSPPRVSPMLGLPDKKSIKRSSPPPEVHIPEKKPKPESPEDKQPAERGIKLIPPKPKPVGLQESDVFMDAIFAANSMKEPRKRKRKLSTSKESGSSEPKKDATGQNSPASSPIKGERDDIVSPSSIKPSFRFYQDTLDTSTEEDKMDLKAEDENMEFAEPNNDGYSDDRKSLSSEDDRTSVKTEGADGPLRGVLIHLKTKRQKKSVTWKEDGLEAIKYFELDETERVNVTKNFADMKSMEREHERENFQIARKLSMDDIMEERIRWKALIPIDITAPVVASGKNSQEKEIQYAREKTVLAAIYINRRAIPDCPSEPDLEIHATTDPVSIPLDDITGSTDSINDFTGTPWPEPRVQPPAPPPPPAPLPVQGPVGPAPFPPGPGPFPPMGPFIPGPMATMPPGMPTNAECWRTGDGKIIPMGPGPEGMMPPGFPGPMMPGMPPMMPPGMPIPPDMPFPMMSGPGPNPSPEEMAAFSGGFPPMGPPPPGMFGPPMGGPPMSGPPMSGPPMSGPPQGSQGGNWQGGGGGPGPGSGGGGGNWYGGGGGGGSERDHGSGRYQGNNWRGGGGRGNNRNPDGWGGGGGNMRTPLCNNILKKGFCRNMNCRFRHPK